MRLKLVKLRHLKYKKLELGIVGVLVEGVAKYPLKPSIDRFIKGKIDYCGKLFGKSYKKLTYLVDVDITYFVGLPVACSIKRVYVHNTYDKERVRQWGRSGT